MSSISRSDAIYLDNNSTTPILPAVADAMREAALCHAANPASQHRAGQQARRALEDTRERIAERLGAKTLGRDADNLIFTSGGTESNNLAILGMLAATRPGHVITSAIEHPSVVGPVAHLERHGWEVTRVRAGENGMVCLDEIKAAFRDDTRLVSIMACNNETGVIQPFVEISESCFERGILFHTDAVQLVGENRVSFRSWKMSALSFTAHKFNGPLGIGGLVLRHGISLAPRFFGGHQQAGLRPGTESVALAVGMLVALESWLTGNDQRNRHLEHMRQTFEAAICDAIPDAVVIGRASKRKFNTSNISFPGVNRQALFLALDIAGVACSTGSACASGSSEPSPVLLAMGLVNELVEGALRFSFGAENTLGEAEEAARRIIKAYQHLRR